eukprot:EG_transcript_113
MEEIEKEFRVKAERDCFATSQNARCEKFYGEDDDAMKKDWGAEETLWMNPPWTLWPEVAEKLQNSNCRAICICPDWNRRWVKNLVAMAVKKIYFPKGTKLFEADGRILRGTRWGVWALLIDRRQPSQGGAAPGKKKLVRLKKRMLRGTKTRGGSKKLGEDRQLLLKTQIKLANGEEKTARILIDTGAEANLIRQGLIGDHLMYPAKDPLRFETANGQTLAGGSRCAKVKMILQQNWNEEREIECVEYEVEFYEANIKVDAILSYPWLAEAKLGIFPHHKALVKDSPDLIFLRGVERRRGPQKFRDDTNFSVDNVTVADGSSFGLQKLGLCLPLEGLDQELQFLSDEDLGEVATNLEGSDPPVQVINRMIIAREGEDKKEDERVVKLREQVLEDYRGTVFRSSPFPDPPERGQYGYAYIPLKEGAKPTRQKPFFMHGERKEALEKITQDWLDKKYIEPATAKNSEWLSQTFPVPKKSNDFPWRGVVDLRGPNSQTRRCNYPLPKIEDILVKHGANQMFSIIDLKQAFHQQPLHPESRPITCCFTPKGIFQWRVNVMGLTNAPQQFQQMIDDRLTPVRDIATGYIDDILVGTTVGEGEDLVGAHEKDLRRVLEVLKTELLVADEFKAKLFVEEVEFCGQILGNGTRRPAPGKLRAIEKWEVPKTITALRAFLGFTNYYNAYIHMYAEVAARLQDKLKVPREVGKKGSRKPVEFDGEDLKAFEELKKRLCSGLMLQRVDPDKPFVLRVDASGYAVGATLEQMKEGGGRPTAQDVIEKKTVPVAFMSRKLTEGQRKWTPRELETYAIILALQKWESWIGLQPVLVLTDHQSLESWTREVLDTPSGPVGRRARWHQIFSKYDLTVGYIPGKENTIADILSRWAYPASQALRDISKHGSAEDKDEMENFIREEKEEEKQCLEIRIKNQPNLRNAWIRGVTTRSGKNVTPEEEKGECTRRGTEGGVDPGGKDTPVDTHSQGPRKEKKRVHFWDEKVGGETTPVPETAESSRGDTRMEVGDALPSTTPKDIKPVWERDWGEAYSHCPTWKEKWVATKGDSIWPKGFKVLNGQLFFEEKLCVPESFQHLVIQEIHEFLGHVGPEKVWKHMAIRFVWADEKAAKQLNQNCSKNCSTCQASVRGESLKGPIESTPIPPALMTSVAIDLFRMPRVLHDGGEYDTLALCVDRHSGWIVGVACKDKGLTGAKLAKEMVKNQWRPFGVPSVISSDQGSHFTSTWWKNMCALLGIRQAYSQAYHHQANGRVERAGQQVMEVLRKLYVEEKINWVEALPQVLDRIHDVKGESGFSPYEIVTGRERPLAGVPYQPPKECEDSVEFFRRMQDIDGRVARILNKKHEEEVARINKGRKEMEPLKVGTTVWYRRPEGSGEKLDSRWVGPGVVKGREGERSYVIEMKPGVETKAHRSFLKEYREPQVEGKGVPLFYYKRTEKEEEALPDEWEVEKILRHRKGKDGKWEFLTKWEVEKILRHRKGKDGKWEFLTKWVGYEDGEETWEPAGNFIHRFSGEFVKYCREKKVKMDIMSELKIDGGP